jgi:hypothetical protein
LYNFELWRDIDAIVAPDEGTAVMVVPDNVETVVDEADVDWYVDASLFKDSRGRTSTILLFL